MYVLCYVWGAKQYTTGAVYGTISEALKEAFNLFEKYAIVYICKIEKI